MEFVINVNEVPHWFIVLPKAGTQGLLKTQAIMLSYLLNVTETSYIILLTHKISTFQLLINEL